MSKPDVYKLFGKESNPAAVNAMNMSTGIKEGGLHKIFFKPDDDFIDWLIDYADDRLIFDVGSGSGHLLRLLSRKYKRLMGIEPMFDYEVYLKMCHMNKKQTIHMHPMPVEDSGGLIPGVGEKGMVVFARPSHSGFVEKTLDLMAPGQEALYITIRENWKMYNDLGKYRDLAKQVQHKGSSEEFEDVWSIIKE